MASLVAKLCTSRLFRQSVVRNACLVIGNRTFLSESYGRIPLLETLTAEAANVSDLPSQCLKIDRSMERNFNVTSLMIDRIIRSVRSPHDVEAMKYYLYNFRHSVNGCYLHPWTTYVFSIKCLDLNTETWLEVLNNKAQYGIFPHFIHTNQFLDKFLKQDDMNGAMEIVKQKFLLELLDQKSSQSLVLKFITNYWKQNAQEENVLPEFKDQEAKRNLAACIFIIGKHTTNPSLTVAGLSLLGSIEKEHGIRAVYQQPWGPLLWEEGYLQKATKTLQNATTPVSQECVDILKQCIGDEDPLLDEVNAICETLNSTNMILENDELTMQGVSDKLIGELQEFEKEDHNLLETDMNEWIEERGALYEIEQELIESKKKHRETYLANQNLEKSAHQGAIEELGYYFLEKGKKKRQKHVEDHLKEDYIEGCLLDLEMVELLREKKGIVKDPVIYIPRIKKDRTAEKQKPRRTRDMRMKQRN